MSQDVYALLDLNKKELLTLAGNAYKMVWEQILLLAISARQQYFNRDTHEGFHQRVKMVHILKKESSSSNSNENI